MKERISSSLTTRGGIDSRQRYKGPVNREIFVGK
jgi:hypothetical protein